MTVCAAGYACRGRTPGAGAVLQRFNEREEARACSERPPLWRPWPWALALVLTLALGGVAFAEKTYINGIDANYPPFAYVDKSGKPAGFDVDSMDWIAKKMGFKVTHQPMDWDGIIPNLLAKKIDMVCSGMSITEERREKVNFSNPYWNVKQVFIAKKGSTLDADKILKGKVKLGVQRGTSEAEALQKDKEAKGYGYDLRFYDSAPLAVEDVLNGRIDAATMDNLPADDAAAELLKLINDGYKLLMADPYWEQLKQKHLAKK